MRILAFHLYPPNLETSEIFIQRKKQMLLLSLLKPAESEKKLDQIFSMCSSLVQPTLCSFQVNGVKSCNWFRDSRRPANASTVHCSHTEDVRPSFTKTSHRILADFHRCIIALDPVLQTYFTSWSSRRQHLSVLFHNRNTASRTHQVRFTKATELSLINESYTLHMISSHQITSVHLVHIYS